MAAADRLNELFPLPISVQPPSWAPSLLAGPTHESTTKLIELLKENHRRFHCFFNQAGLHNHLAHHLLAVYALGASPTLLQAAFDLHASYQRSIDTSRDEVTLDNWKQYLGKQAYYPGYLKFFTEQILSNGTGPTLERFVFSPDANYEDGNARMFARLLSGLVHPLIHLGHGPEFGLPGLTAEGLALAAVSTPIAAGLFPKEFFTEQPPPAGPHALSIAASIMKDEELSDGKGSNPNSDSGFQDAIRRSGKRLSEHFKPWSPAGSFSERFEELAWLVTCIYGLSGWREGQKFKANFFMLHLVTSSLFLPSLASELSERSVQLLLRGFLMTALTYWVGHGRPDWFIEAFYKSTSTTLSPPHNDPSPAKETLDASNIHPNPWLLIIQSALNHPDEHLVKIQRSLIHFAALYGKKAPGCLGSTTLPSADLLDGTFFVRVAEITGEAKAWVREGEPSDGAEWNRRY